MAGKIDVTVRIEFTERKQKISGKLIKMHVFLGFEPFLLSNSEAEWRDVVPAPQM